MKTVLFIAVGMLFAVRAPFMGEIEGWAWAALLGIVVGVIAWVDRHEKYPTTLLEVEFGPDERN